LFCVWQGKRGVGGGGPSIVAGKKKFHPSSLRTGLTHNEKISTKNTLFQRRITQKHTNPRDGARDIACQKEKKKKNCIFYKKKKKWCWSDSCGKKIITASGGERGAGQKGGGKK